MVNEIGERSYPFHGSAEQKGVQKLFNTKFEKNRAAGAAASKTGEHGVYSGFKREAMDNLFEVDLSFSQKTLKEIRERVVSPMSKIATELGIRDSVVFAGEGDQEAHVTLHVGRFEKMSPEKKATILNWLVGVNAEGESISHLEAVNQILSGLRFRMDTVFNSGRDTSIAASTVDGANQGAAYRTRKIFERVLDRAQKKFTEGEEKIGQHYPRYDDIFHTTIARFTQKVPSDKLTEFNRRVSETIGTDLNDHPINIEVEKARAMIALKGVEERMPSLLS